MYFLLVLLTPNHLEASEVADGTVKVLVEGACRAKITSFTENEAFLRLLQKKLKKLMVMSKNQICSVGRWSLSLSNTSN